MDWSGGCRWVKLFKDYTIYLKNSPMPTKDWDYEQAIERLRKIQAKKRGSKRSRKANSRVRMSCGKGTH
jgi:hypothetical protein